MSLCQPRPGFRWNLRKKPLGGPVNWRDRPPLSQDPDFRHAHPRTAELVIGVCVTSHEFDRSKLRAHASAGMKECWLVLGPEQKNEVQPEPVGARFAACSAHGPGGTLASTVVSDFTVDLDNVFAA